MHASVAELVKLNYYINKHDKTIELFYNIDSKYRITSNIGLASNVFELKFICVNDEFPLPRLFNCLKAMYSAFPDRDYCIMVIPQSASTLRSHVEALKYFMVSLSKLKLKFLLIVVPTSQPVAQRPTDLTNLREIFITHRSTIFGEIRLVAVRRAHTRP